MKNTQKEIFFPNNIWVPQVDTDLKLLEVVDSLGDGTVYLLYLGEGGAGADPAARRRQRPLIIIVLLKRVTIVTLVLHTAVLLLFAVTFADPNSEFQF
jgi:hypothetical protein